MSIGPLHVLRDAPEQLVVGLMTVSVPFGCFAGGLVYLGFVQWEISPAPAGLAAAAVGLGFALGAPIGLLRRQRDATLERVPTAKIDEIWETRHERTVEVPLSYEATFELCSRGVVDVLDWSQGRKDYEGGIISARGWDSRLRLEVYGRGLEPTRVVIIGHGRRLQLFDDGKNLHNVVRLERFLREQGAASPVK